MGGDPASRESKPYCAYHKEKCHLIENCRAYKGFLEELVCNGHLRQFVDDTKQRQQWDNPSKPKDPIRIIEVIHSHQSNQPESGNTGSRLFTGSILGL
jgi:hypothetical protein